MQPKCECGADQVPGRTITESEYITIRDEHVSTGAVRSASAFFNIATGLGIAVVPDPDPEPTNADRIIALMGMAPANLNRRELAKWLDSRGVKVPGGDDE